MEEKFFYDLYRSSISIIGSAAVQFTLIWYLTLQTESAVVLTTAAIVGFLSSAVLSPFAGVWFDRYNRKTIMILSDGFIALSSVVLMIAFLRMGDVAAHFSYIALALRNVGTTFHTPAMHAATPAFVPTEHLMKAGGWGSFINSGSNILGPLIGAFLMGILLVAYVMLVDIFGAAFAIVCLLFVKIPNIPRQNAENTPFLVEFKQGIRAARKQVAHGSTAPVYLH